MAFGCCTTRDFDIDESSSENHAPFCLGIARRLGLRPHVEKDYIPEGLNFEFANAVPLSSVGGDKHVYGAEYKGRAAVVVKGLAGHAYRVQHEISIFKQLGRHPNIIEFFCAGWINNEPIYAMEAVEPVGYDMNRLIHQFSFQKAPLPPSLSFSLIDQLIAALSFMHLKKIIHRDLKTANVLVTSDNSVKLIDMGIACEIGTRGDLQYNGYMAPEVCKCETQTAKVDCWGVGVILHEIYQGRFDLLVADDGEVRMRRDMPSDEYPMPRRIKETMIELLRMDPSQRWSLEDVLRSPWFAKEVCCIVTPRLQTMKSAELIGFIERYGSQPLSIRRISSSYSLDRTRIRKYVPSLLISAFAVHVNRLVMSHIIGKQLHELDFAAYRSVILLIRHSDGKFERIPGKDTKITENSWIYFGFDPSALSLSHEGREMASSGKMPMESNTEADSFITPGTGLPRQTSPYLLEEKAGLEDIWRTIFKGKGVPKFRDKDASALTTTIVRFRPEFDAFVFPDRKGDGSNCSYVMGPEASSESQIALNIRNTMGLNICGIVRIDRDDRGRETHTEQWFPGPRAIARPGDYGLLVRAPRENGYSEPTVVDSDLDILFDKETPLPTETLDLASNHNTSHWSDHSRFRNPSSALTVPDAAFPSPRRVVTPR